MTESPRLLRPIPESPHSPPPTQPTEHQTARHTHLSKNHRHEHIVMQTFFLNLYAYNSVSLRECDEKTVWRVAAVFRSRFGLLT